MTRVLTPGRRSACRCHWHRSRPCRCRRRGPGLRPRFRWIRRRGEPGLREDLIELAADAAGRAWELASGLSDDAGLTLDPDVDLARRAARTLGTPAFTVLAARSGVPPRDLARQALAWRQGDVAGLRLLRGRWDPAAEDPDTAGLLEAAQAALRAKTGAPEAVQGNWVTAGRLQLRLGRDLRWYPYSRSDQEWEPSGTPETDPVLALANL